MLGLCQRQKGGVGMLYRMTMQQTLGVFVLATFIFGGFSMAAAGRVWAGQPKATLQMERQNPASVVNVNKATAEELDAIRGVGPVLADRIIKYREQNGAFKNVDELTKVRGINGSKFKKIKEQITV